LRINIIRGTNWVFWSKVPLVARTALIAGFVFRKGCKAETEALERRLSWLIKGSLLTIMKYKANIRNLCIWVENI